MGGLVKMGIQFLFVLIVNIFDDLIYARGANCTSDNIKEYGCHEKILFS